MSSRSNTNSDHISTQQLKSLNPAQKAAAIHSSGPALVMAGAGSGKTRVLTTRVAWLIQVKKVDPTQIMLVTFTNKAAQEMGKRVHQLTGMQLSWAGTFHRLSAKILRQHGYLLGLPPSFTIYDSDDQLSLIKQIYKQHGLDAKQFHPKAVKAAISEAKNELIDWETYQKLANDRFKEFTARVYKLYQHALREQHATDFDDLLLLAVELLQKHKPVLAKYQAQFEHVLVDEYQDTNKAQYLLTTLLAKPQNNVFVVGDFAQSIYAWRGADFRNMMLLKEEFPDIVEYKLEQNYRSTQTILDAATQVISQTTAHPVLTLWTDNPAADKIRVIEAPTGEIEAETVINRIQGLRSQGYHYHDCAVLYRTNAQSRAFEEACVRTGTPYRLVGGFKFYERKEIKDVLAYLRLFLNPNDSVSAERLKKLGKRKFSEFESWANERRIGIQTDTEPLFLAGAANDTTIVADTIPTTVVAVSTTNSSDLGPYHLLQEILDITHYVDSFDRHDPEEVARVDNIQELLNVAAQFDQVATFLENVALVQDDTLADADQANQQEAITLMSLHSAKGLEFPVVFMVGMEEGLLPHSRALLDKDQLEEERRLCYVGITRAQKQLYLTHARQRWTYGTSSYAVRSRFLADIPEHLTVVEALASYQTTSIRTKSSSGKGWSSWNTTDEFEAEPDPLAKWGWPSTKASAPAKARSAGRVVLDDDQLEAFLNGEIGAKNLLD